MLRGKCCSETHICGGIYASVSKMNVGGDGTVDCNTASYFWSHLWIVISIRNLFALSGNLPTTVFEYRFFMKLQSPDNSDQAPGEEIVPLRVPRRRAFTIAWASAVVVATAGWFYLIFQVVWYFVSPVLQ